MYYNTNKEKGSVLKKSWDKAASQECVITAFFMSNRGKFFRPDQIHNEVLPWAPLTSIRRALTNLTSKGVLVKTVFMGKGNMGKQVHLWKYNNRRET